MLTLIGFTPEEVRAIAYGENSAIKDSISGEKLENLLFYMRDTGQWAAAFEQKSRAGGHYYIVHTGEKEELCGLWEEFRRKDEQQC